MSDFDLVKLSPKARYSKFRRVVGTGAYKVVHQGYDSETSTMVAWNEVDLNKLNEIQKEKIRDEIRILVNLKQQHPNILNIRSSWLEKDTNTVVFVTDLFTSGSLRTFIQRVKRFKVRTLKKWALQVLDGLSFLHSRHIIHRDLKCDNLFIRGSTGDIVIGDFGISRVTSETGNASTILGTPEYMAPEIYEEKYSSKSDIYSFGMCILEMVTNRVPYSECNSVPQIWKKVTEEIRPEALSTVTIESLRNLIESCAHFDQEMRPSIESIMHHPFFIGTEYDDDYIDFSNGLFDTALAVEPKTIEQQIEEVLNNEGSVVDELSSQNVKSDTSVSSESGEKVGPEPAEKFIDVDADIEDG